MATIADVVNFSGGNCYYGGSPINCAAVTSYAVNAANASKVGMSLRDLRQLRQQQRKQFNQQQRSMDRSVRQALQKVLRAGIVLPAGQSTYQQPTYPLLSMPNSMFQPIAPTPYPTYYPSVTPINQVYRPPVQQPIYQQPIYQQPAYQQPYQAPLLTPIDAGYPASSMDYSQYGDFYAGTPYGYGVQAAPTQPVLVGEDAAMMEALFSTGGGDIYDMIPADAGLMGLGADAKPSEAAQAKQFSVDLQTMTQDALKQKYGEALNKLLKISQPPKGGAGGGGGMDASSWTPWLIGLGIVAVGAVAMVGMSSRRSSSASK